jgi:hypothetical protein
MKKHTRIPTFKNWLIAGIKMAIRNILFLVLIIPATLFASIDNKCESFFRSEFSPNLKESWVWKPGDGIFMGLRSNVHHFWQWASQNKNLLPTRLLRFEGWVLGDAHLFNFAEVRQKDGSLKWSFNDLDDSGIGPFILDLVRYASTVKTSGYQKAEFVELYEAYVDAIRGEKYPKPKIVQSLREVTDTEMQTHLTDFVDKLINAETAKINYGIKCIVCFNDGPLPMQNFVNEHIHYFEAFLPQFAEITDVAFRTKETGGSQGQVRVFISAKVNNEFIVYEFKPLVRSGLDYYQEQVDQKKRINGIMKQLWKDSEATDYRYIQIGDREFFMRVRLPKVFEFHDPDEFLAMSKKDQKEYLLYIANWMGKKHRDQLDDAEGYLVELEKVSTQQTIEKFMEQYLGAAEKLNTPIFEQP